MHPFVKGSPERRKVIKALCHAYQRATNRRNNFAHQDLNILARGLASISADDSDEAVEAHPLLRWE